MIDRCQHDPRARDRVPRRTSRWRRARQGEGARGIPLPHHDVLLPAAAQAPHDAGAVRSSGRKSSRRSRGAGRAPARLPGGDDEHATWRNPQGRPASRAASTGCAARSRRTRWTGTSPTGPSARRASSTTCARARAVVAGGGYTLMGEAVTCTSRSLEHPRGRPVRTGPQRPYLERLGYGSMSRN